MADKKPLTEAKKRANAKFNINAYDRIELKVSKGKKDIIKVHAEKHQEAVGEIGAVGYTPKGSVNGFINRAIDEKIERDIKGNKVNEKT